MTRLFYHLMYQFTDLVMWANINDRDHYKRWWEVSEYYRRKRDAV